MSERLLAKRQQHDLYPCRKRARRDREVGSREVRPGADRGQQVLDERQVEHLLLGDAHSVRAQPPTTAARAPRGRPSLASRLSEKAAYRYWQMIRCSSSAALASV